MKSDGTQTPPIDPSEDTVPLNVQQQKRKRGLLWTKEEEEMIVLGFQQHGWGHWKEIEPIIQTRFPNAIGKHAAKMRKRNPELFEKHSKNKNCSR